MPQYRLDYENPFEMLAHFTDIARGTVLAQLRVEDTGSLAESFYPITVDEMLYVSFIVGYFWDKYQANTKRFYLYADTDDDLVYFKLKLDSAKMKRVRLPR